MTRWQTVRAALWLMFGLLTVLPTAALAQTAPAELIPTAVSSTERALASQGIGQAELAPYPTVAALLARDDAAGALLALAADLVAHENDPAYFDLTGLIALRANDHVAAAAAFERVVLMQPDNAGAWLDLAVATFNAGNLQSATSYFDHIENQFAPPTALRQLIAQYRARIAAPSIAKAGWRLVAEAFVGVDTNANSGLKTDSIALTIADQRIDLLLDPAYQAQRDTYLQAGLTANYKAPLGDHQLEFVLGARQRSYTHTKDFSTLDLQLGAALHRPTDWGDVSLWMHVADLSLGGSQLIRSLRTSVQLERPLAGCRAGLSVESDLRRYVTQSNLNANLLWGQAGLACEFHLARLPIQSTVLVRTGLDNPTGIRPGGVTHHQELIAQLGFPLAWGINADLSAAWSSSGDTEGYSVLLENNSSRQLDRQHVKFSLSLPLAGGWEALLTLDDSRVRSNLPLFAQTGRVLNTGVRRAF